MTSEPTAAVWSCNLITEFARAKEIEVLKVSSYENSGDRMIFNCTSRNGARDLTIIIPNPTKATAPDIYRISPKTGEEEQIRFHLDYSKDSRHLNTHFSHPDYRCALHNADKEIFPFYLFWWAGAPSCRSSRWMIK